VQSQENETGVRLGYLLARSGVTIPGSTQSYRGIDRLPFVPDPLETSSPRRDAIWSRYLESWEDGRISRDPALASAVQQELGEIGNQTEVLYAEALIVPGEAPIAETDQVKVAAQQSLSWLRARASDIPAPDPNVELVGLDVALLIPDFHSALLQPGTPYEDDKIKRNQNEHTAYSRPSNLRGEP
jgi:hypothetical protein